LDEEFELHVALVQLLVQLKIDLDGVEGSTSVTRIVRSSVRIFRTGDPESPDIWSEFLGCAVEVDVDDPLNINSSSSS
jgi:hypothetical protein